MATDLYHRNERMLFEWKWRHTVEIYGIQISSSLKISNKNILKNILEI